MLAPGGLDYFGLGSPNSPKNASCHPGDDEKICIIGKKQIQVILDRKAPNILGFFVFLLQPSYFMFQNSLGASDCRTGIFCLGEIFFLGCRHWSLRIWLEDLPFFLNTAARFCLLVAISYLKNPILLGGVFLFLFFLRAFKSWVVRGGKVEAYNFSILQLDVC